MNSFLEHTNPDEPLFLKAHKTKKKDFALRTTKQQTKQKSHNGWLLQQPFVVFVVVMAQQLRIIRIHHAGNERAADLNPELTTSLILPDSTLGVAT